MPVHKPTEITLDPQWINGFIGIYVSRDKMISILERLGCSMKGDTIIVPSFRKDLEHKADIAEEIARFHGYDKIPSTAIRGTAQGALTEFQKFERTVTNTLLAQGCYEISTYSFISPKYYDKICLPADSTLQQIGRYFKSTGRRYQRYENHRHSVHDGDSLQELQ